MADDRTPEAAWRKAVSQVLKGAEAETLVVRRRDGIAIQPLYPKAEDIGPRPRRDPTAQVGILQRIDHPDPAEANHLARLDLTGGATGLALVLAGETSDAPAPGIAAPISEALASLLDGLPLDGVTLRLEGARHVAPAALASVSAILARQGVAAGAIAFDVGLDPLDSATLRDGATWATWVAATSRNPATRPRPGALFRADGRSHHEAGASDAQELAAVLAMGVAGLRAAEPAVGLEAARDALGFTLAADADQVLTIAKFRALRVLWARIEEACGVAPAPIRLHAETAWRMLTRRDPQTNLVRNTIAAAAAILGGADSLTVLPHTSALGRPDAFARRLARNTALILLEEAHLGRVTDPAAGSGAFEALTDAFCAEAWRLFQDLDRAESLQVGLAGESWRAAIARSRADRQEAFASGAATIVGVTQFRADGDTALAEEATRHEAEPRGWRDASPFETSP